MTDPGAAPGQRWLPDRGRASSLSVGLLLGALLASGVAGLGYEIVWTWMLSMALGHEFVAALAVVGAFFAGISLGAWCLDGPIRRAGRPARWYVGLELAIGAWALVSVFSFSAVAHGLAQAIGPEPSMLRQWTGVFLGTFVLLLPATFAMGATLPALERVFSGLRHGERVVGGLYGANTLGAVLGTLATAFVLAPTLGFRRSLMLLALLNFVGAACVWVVMRDTPDVPAPTARQTSSPTIGQPALVLALLLSGVAGLAYEVLVVRALSQVLENTVYTFAAVLAVYLLGTSAGALLYQRYASTSPFAATLRALAIALSAACLVGTASLWLADGINTYLVRELGSGQLSAALAEMLLATLAFGLPTLLMGALFSHLAQGARDGLGLGKAIAVNTAGAAIAPLGAGVLLLPAIGAKNALIAVAALYLLLPLVLTLPMQGERARVSRGMRLAHAGGAVAVLALLLTPWPLRHVSVPDQGKVMAYAEGVMAAVAVVSDARDTRYLKVDNHFTMGSSATGFADRRQAHLPLLLHPAPSDALFLGLGTGATFAGALEHPRLNATAVELLPELIPLLGYFGTSVEDFRDAGLTVLNGDARRYVSTMHQDYDVIVAEVFHPSRDGAGALYTAEHFAAIRDHLREDGLFCQWLPLFQLDLPTLRSIVRTFTSVFPRSEAYLAHFSLGQPVLGLVGRHAHYRYDEGWLEARLEDPRLGTELRRQRLSDDYALFGNFLGADDALVAFAGPGPLNTDDHPVVLFQAPRFIYGARVGPPAERLLALTRSLAPDPMELIGTSGTDDDRQRRARLAAYWRARNAFLEAGVGIQPSEDVRSMLDAVREPLLDVVRMSPDFLPAYRPLLGMAAQLAQIDRAAAQRLLIELEAANPTRPEARQLRERLGRL